MNRVCELFNIEYPIVQGGMVWCSGWRLASAVSNCGGLGLLGAGSMHPEMLEEHICNMLKATSKPFGVNVPLLYPEQEELFRIIVKYKVPVVFTSAGNPKKWTGFLKEQGIKVAHVVSSTAFALKCEEAGVDAIVAEGFEAGGHNGREETTTLALVPAVRSATSLPVLAAGGIVSGKSVFAAMALGADGVQIGSLFATAEESSAHENFKSLITRLKEGDTMLSMKKIAPVRLIKNGFFDLVNEAEQNCATVDELKTIKGKGLAKKGMFEGDIINGELEIGQAISQINEIKPVREIFNDLIDDFNRAASRMAGIKW